MTQPACACGQPVNGAFLCAACTDDLRWALVTAAILGPQLDIARSRQARFTDASGTSASRAHPLPYDPRAAEAADRLAAVLAAWWREPGPDAAARGGTRVLRGERAVGGVLGRAATPGPSESRVMP